MRRNVLILTCLVTMLANTSAVFAGNTDKNAGVEELVRETFADAPYMVTVLKCESELRQFDEKTGQVLISSSNDVGVSQINLKVHAKTARDLGFDIYTTVGNLAYARYLFELRGTEDWYMSKHCWGKKRTS